MTDETESDRSTRIRERSTAALESVEFSRGRVALWIVALFLLAVLAYVSWRYVGTAVLGLFAYYVTRPVFHRMLNRTSSRTAAVAASLLLVALPVLVLVGWTLVVAVRSLREFGSDGGLGQLEDVLSPYFDIEASIEELETTVEQIIANPGQLNQLNLGSITADLVDVLSTSAVILLNGALHLFIALVIVFYLLRDGHRLAKWAQDTFLETDGVVETYLRAVDRDLKNVYFGNILNALFTGLLGAVTYTGLNAFSPTGIAIPEAGLIGLLAGAASLIPVIGIKLIWIPVGVYLFGLSVFVGPETLWFPVVFAAVSIVIVDYIPDQLLRPYVSGRSLHVGAVMIAYTLGPLMFGWYGIFLGPLVLVVVFEFGRIVLPWLIRPERPIADVEPLAETDEEEASERATEPDRETHPDSEDEQDSPVNSGPREGRDSAGE
ncbi:Predicted PurR-regulated permease PerM [Halopelagius inordinatus]|uniref:Predicted PurR-regulated permease PerM n=1 Tax=Halopelagius inordinatus TaxID=553467 RepID=A0A1I2U0R0_9EURY|nr:AI-2E family transporter [Halopelagius inordinatus]SFG70740.1 Predicted PurR-regulated permease PerM [Halopelagius inordinatus]